MSPRARVEHLTQENITLHSSQCTRCAVRTNRQSRDHHKGSLASGHEVGERNSYMKPTIASKDRASSGLGGNSDSTEHGHGFATIGESPYQYHQGRPLYIGPPPVYDSWSIKPGYMRETNSSLGKVTWNLSCFTRRLKSGLPPHITSELQSQATSSAVPAPGEEDCITEPSRIPKQMMPPTTDGSSTPTVYIHSASGFRYLRTAFESVRQLVHDTARERWPAVYRIHYKDGPHLVKLGREELHRVIGGGELCIGYDVPSLVRSALLENVHLRNANSSAIDEVLASAQKLAAYIGNEEETMRFRGLRDDLAKEARQTLSDFEDALDLASLPFAGTLAPWWESHHEEHFWLNRDYWKKGEGYSEEVLTIALQYYNSE
ncbi:Uu.00g052090.m01.CDS01 [Anthostomella pinea]|uniref:Uu.00g052090.m01.CDS01 n=1 Tax=Anthostomella pinea TaxID=933095 RepID=A0AAI8VWX1_9PEZI|nr:Uu.00g052090.m01.CDS01 [Anthostomella pinea]